MQIKDFFKKIEYFGSLLFHLIIIIFLMTYVDSDLQRVIIVILGALWVINDFGGNDDLQTQVDSQAKYW